MSKELIVPSKTFLLNDNNAEKFIKVNKDGSIKSMLKNVKLSLKEGHIYQVPKSNKWQITAEGYIHLNKYTGLEIIKEERLKISEEGDGQFIPNPYIVLDEKGKKSKVWSKTSVAGRGPNGDFRIVSATIMYDAEDGFITDILKKIKYDNTGELGKTCTETIANKHAEKGENVVYFPINDFMGVMLNLDHIDGLQAIINYQDNKNVMDRKLQTMSLRNAFKKHPAIAKATVSPQTTQDGDQVCFVPVVMWLDGITNEEKAQIEEYRNGISIVSELEPEEMEVPTEEDEVKEVEESDIIDAEIIEEPQQEDLSELISKLGEGLNIIGQDEFEKILESKGVEVTPIAEMNKKQLNWCINIINSTLDQEEEMTNEN